MVSLLKQYKVTDKAAWRQFLLHNHPDKGGDCEVFTDVKNAYEKYGPQLPKEPGRCECITKNGTQCKNKIKGKSKKCSYHTPKNFTLIDISKL